MVREHVVLEGAGEEFNAFLTEFQRESDRATAVLGAAMLDNLLEALILRLVRDPDTARERLLTNSGPLGALSARIDVAHAFGLLADRDAADLHDIRRIRNDFAHQLHGLTFDTQRIADRSRNLRCVNAVFEAHRDLPGVYGDSPRQRYVLAVALLGNWIRQTRVHRIAEPPTSPNTVNRA
jgi:hypothetical protein